MESINKQRLNTDDRSVGPCPLRGKGGAVGTKGVCKRTASLGAKRRRDAVRRHFERNEDVYFHRPKGGCMVF